MKDEIFQNPEWEESLKVFHFQKDVSNVFDDMISRSVPFYKETQTLVKKSAWAATVQWQATQTTFKKKKASSFPKTPLLLDLGCSTGTTLLAIKNTFALANEQTPQKNNAVKLPDAKAIGIDSSPFMLNKAREKLFALSQNFNTSASKKKTSQLGLDVIFVEDDITNFYNHIGKNERCIFFSLCYTLQFLAPQKRLALLKKICKALTLGGRLIVCEKVVEDSPLLTSEAEKAYYNFKRSNHYSETEIARKRKSLENMLIPDTTGKHLHRLKQAGFNHVAVLHKWFNFVVLCAVK